MPQRVKYLRCPVDPVKRAASLQILKEAEINRSRFLEKPDLSKCQLTSYPGERELGQESEGEDD